MNVSHNRFLEVIAFWFPNDEFQEFWFGSDKDGEIKERFLSILNILESSSYEQIMEFLHSLDSEDSKENQYDIILAVIIILDQFSRNIYRNSNFRVNDEKCFKIVTNLENIKDKYPVHKKIFLFLPFRHQRTTELNDRVMVEIQQWKMVHRSSNESNIIRRFENATLKGYSSLTDTIQFYLDTDSKDSFDNIRTNTKILDKRCYKNGNIDTTILHITADSCYLQLYNTMEKYLSKHKMKNIGVSLSGGVDSMVISYILHHMQKNKVIDNVVAVHIDYANRKISEDESNFVRYWCEFMNIPLFVRRINHMKRHGSTIVSGEIDRAFYESETKNIRFNLYKHATKLYNLQGFILGHHKNDLAENILMNVFRGNDLLDLNGMKTYHIIDSIPICRPLLDNPKSCIFEVAHKYNVPYLADTTSENCYRGLMRNQVFPAINDFDKSIEHNIILAGERSLQWKTVIESFIIDPILASVVDRKYGFYFKWQPKFKEIPLACWSKILSSIFHSRSINMMSHKNVETFIGWIGRNHLSDNMFICSNNYTCFFFEDTIYFVSRKMAYRHENIDGTDIKINNQFTIYNNKWKIELKKNPDSKNLINTKNIFSGPVDINDIMNGQFIMRIIVPSVSSDMTEFSGCINYSNNTFEGFLKKYFKNTTYLTKYIPKVHIDTPKIHSFDVYDLCYTFEDF